MVYPTLLPLMRTPRLPVDRTDAPRRFKWTCPFRRKTKSGFCACAITFQLASIHSTGGRLDPRAGLGAWAGAEKYRPPTGIKSPYRPSLSESPDVRLWSVCWGWHYRLWYKRKNIGELLSSGRLTTVGTLGAEFGGVALHPKADNLSSVIVLFYFWTNTAQNNERAINSCRICDCFPYISCMMRVRCGCNWVVWMIPVLICMPTYSTGC